MDALSQAIQQGTSRSLAGLPSGASGGLLSALLAALPYASRGQVASGELGLPEVGSDLLKAGGSTVGAMMSPLAALYHMATLNGRGLGNDLMAPTNALNAQSEAGGSLLGYLLGKTGSMYGSAVGGAEQNPWLQAAGKGLGEMAQGRAPSFEAPSSNFARTPTAAERLGYHPGGLGHMVPPASAMNPPRPSLASRGGPSTGSGVGDLLQQIRQAAQQRDLNLHGYSPAEMHGNRAQMYGQGFEGLKRMFPQATTQDFARALGMSFPGQ